MRYEKHEHLVYHIEQFPFERLGQREGKTKNVDCICRASAACMELIFLNSLHFICISSVEMIFIEKMLHGSKDDQRSRSSSHRTALTETLTYTTYINVTLTNFASISKNNLSVFHKVFFNFTALLVMSQSFPVS